METLLAIYRTVINHYNNMKIVDEDGIYVIAALSYFFSHDPSLI